VDEQSQTSSGFRRLDQPWVVDAGGFQQFKTILRWPWWAFSRIFYILLKSLEQTPWLHGYPSEHSLDILVVRRTPFKYF